MVKLIPYLIGIGLALIPFHRYPVAPLIGYTFLYSSIIIFLVEAVRHKEKPNWGNKHFLLPFLTLLAIVLIQTVLGLTDYASMLFMLTMVLLFIVSSNQKLEVFKPLTILCLALGISTMIYGMQGIRSGGIIDQPNYNIATGALILSLAVTRWKYKWILVAIALPGAIMTGAEEAIFALVITLAYLLITRDVSKKALPTMVVLTTMVIVTLSIGNLTNLFPTLSDRIEALYAIAQGENTRENQDIVTGLRMDGYERAITTIEPVGNGYDPVNTHRITAHNLPLRVLYELGPIGSIAWLWLILYGLIKTKWKYTFLMILTLSMFDHFLWTQLAPYTPVICGVASSNPMSSDRLFTGG